MGTNEKIDATGALDACRRSTDATRRIHFARLTASQRASDYVPTSSEAAPACHAICCRSAAGRLQETAATAVEASFNSRVMNNNATLFRHVWLINCNSRRQRQPFHRILLAKLVAHEKANVGLFTLYLL